MTSDVLLGLIAARDRSHISPKIEDKVKERKHNEH